MPKRERIGEVLRNADFFGVFFQERLPRDRWRDTPDAYLMQLGKAFVAENQVTLDALVDRVQRRDVDYVTASDETCQLALQWARTRTGIDFLDREPCPY